MFHVKHPSSSPSGELSPKAPGGSSTAKGDPLRPRFAARATSPLSRYALGAELSSLPDAEGGEDPAQDLFRIDSAGDAIKGAGGEADILRGEFEGLVV